MKPRCTSGTSAASWDSIRAANPPLPLAGRGRRPLGPGQSLPEPASFPLSPTPSATLTLCGESKVRAGWLRGHTPGTEDTEPESPPKRRSTTTPPPPASSEPFHTGDTVVVAFLTYSIQTAKQKQLMGGSVLWATSRPARLLARPFKAWHAVDSNKTRLFSPTKPLIGQLRFLSCHEELFCSIHWIKRRFFCLFYCYCPTHLLNRIKCLTKLCFSSAILKLCLSYYNHGIICLFPIFCLIYFRCRLLFHSSLRSNDVEYVSF